MIWRITYRFRVIRQIIDRGTDQHFDFGPVFLLHVHARPVVVPKPFASSSTSYAIITYNAQASMVTPRRSSFVQNEIFSSGCGCGAPNCPHYVWHVANSISYGVSFFYGTAKYPFNKLILQRQVSRIQQEWLVYWAQGRVKCPDDCMYLGSSYNFVQALTVDQTLIVTNQFSTNINNNEPRR